MKKISLIYKFICLTCAICNIFYLTIIYLNYLIETQVGTYTPIQLKVPKISLCFNLRELLGQEKNVSATTWFWGDESAIPAVIGIKSKYLFNKSPRANETINRCGYRDFNIDTLWSADSRAKCHRIFSVKRYRMLSYMCYLIEPNFTSVSSYSFYRTTKTPHSRPREIYSIKLAAPLNRIRKVAPLIHFDPLPEDDRTFNQEIYPPSTPALYYLTYDRYEFNRLPRPYESECASLSKLTCFTRCRDKVYNAKGYSPTLGLVRDEPAMANISVPKYLDGALGASLRNLSKYSKNFCKEKCGRPACEEIIVKTWTSGPHAYSSGKLGLTIETTRTPHFKVVHRENMLFLDYFTQVLSVLGFCMGFSFLSFASHAHHVVNTMQELERKIQVMQARVMLILRPLSRRRVSVAVSKSLASGRHKLPKASKRAILSILFNGVVLAILLWQIIVVVANYFMYDTKIKIIYDTDPNWIFPSLSICIRLMELFRVNDSEQITEDNYDRILTQRDTSFNMTLRQMFNLVDERTIIHSCRVRNTSDFFDRMVYLDQPKCNSFFTVDKFYWMHHMCFSISYSQPVKERPQSVIRFVANNPGITYSIIVGQKYARVKQLKLIVFGLDPLDPTDSYPHFSKNFAVTSRLGRLKKRLQILAYQAYERILLPAPYEDACVQNDSEMICKVRCHEEALRQLNRTTYTDLLDSPSDFPVLSYTDLKKRDISLKWLEYEKKCHDKCLSVKKCRLVVFNTFLTHVLPSEEELEFAIDSALYPQTKSRSLPLYTLYDLYYQVFASLSFWLGLSFLDFDPLHLANSIKSHSILKHKLVKIKSFRVVIRKLIRSSKLDEKYLRTLKHRWNRCRVKCPPIRDAVVTVTCTVCCLVHVYLVIDGYMLYPTTIETETETDVDTDYSVSLCLNMYGNIDRGKFKDPDSINMAKSEVFNRTIAEIFRSTLRPDELLVECGHRGLAADGDIADVKNRIFSQNIPFSKCNGTIRVRQFLQQSHMCYEFALLNDTYDISPLNLLRHMFMVAVNTSVITDRYIVTVNKERLLPRISQVWSRNLIKSDANIAYTVSYIRYIQNLLPYPYSDGGFTYLSITLCIDWCVQDKFNVYNRTLTDIFTEPNNFRFITYADRKNPPLNKIVTEIVSTCENSCLLNSQSGWNEENRLDFDLFLTVIDDGVETESDTRGKKLTSFSLLTTEHPVVQIRYKKMISPFEGVINFGSALAIWIGIAVYQLNPFRKKITMHRLFRQLAWVETVLDALQTHLEPTGRSM